VEDSFYEPMKCETWSQPRQTRCSLWKKVSTGVRTGCLSSARWGMPTFRCLTITWLPWPAPHDNETLGRRFWREHVSAFGRALEFLTWEFEFPEC